MNHLLLRLWSTCKVWFEISYGWVRFLCFSWPLTIIQISFKKSKMQKDSRLVTITRLKHNCANHIRYIRLLDTIKDIKFRTRHYICCRDTAFNENKKHLWAGLRKSSVCSYAKGRRRRIILPFGWFLLKINSCPDFSRNCMAFMRLFHRMHVGWCMQWKL